MIADEVGMNHNSVWEIITEDLGMRKICAKMVPKLLSNDQKNRRKQVCQDVIERLETDPDLLRRLITGDETGLRVRSGNQVSELAMEEPWVAKTEKSQTVQVEDKGDAHNFLRRAWHRPHGIHPRGSDHEPARVQGDSTAFAALCSRQDTRVVGEQFVVAAPRQRAGAHCSQYLGISGGKKRNGDGATSLLT